MRRVGTCPTCGRIVPIEDGIIARHWPSGVRAAACPMSLQADRASRDVAGVRPRWTVTLRRAPGSALAVEVAPAPPGLDDDGIVVAALERASETGIAEGVDVVVYLALGVEPHDDEIRDWLEARGDLRTYPTITHCGEFRGADLVVWDVSGTSTADA